MCKKLGEHAFIQNQINCANGDKQLCDATFSDLIQRLILQTVTTGQPIKCVPSAASDCSKERREADKIYFVMKEIYRIYPERFWCLVDRHVRSQNTLNHISEVRRKMKEVQFKCEGLPDNYEAFLVARGELPQLTRRCPPRFQLGDTRVTIPLQTPIEQGPRQQQGQIQQQQQFAPQQQRNFQQQQLPPQF